MRLFSQVAIVGTGLIGGSLALAIKEKRLAHEVIGVSRHKQTLFLAKKKRAIDRGSTDIRVIKGADLLVLATPVGNILDSAAKISRIIRPDCIVTDVGSTKEEIVRKLTRIFPHYVGSHPLAGSEKRGIIHAEAKIFRGSVCILTPTEKTDPRTLRKVAELWKKIGAQVTLLDPQTHDKILSFISHLPHIIAFSLIDAVPKRFLEFSPASLKDTTRIAASDIQLWQDIFFTNSRNILKAIGFFQKNLSRIKSAIQKKDKRRLIRILEKAKIKREALK